MTHVVHAELVKSLSNLNLLLRIEKSVGKLLALAQSTLNNLKAGDIAQEVGDAHIVAVGVSRGGGVRILAGLDARKTGVLSD